MEVKISEFEEYLWDHYHEHGNEQSLFMKLVEEMGEAAEVLNKRAGRKAAAEEDLLKELGFELCDIIHYAMAIAAINGIDMTETILEKDKKAAIKYNHRTDLENFVLEKRKDS